MAGYVYGASKKTVQAPVPGPDRFEVAALAAQVKALRNRLMMATAREVQLKNRIRRLDRALHPVKYQQPARPLVPIDWSDCVYGGPEGLAMFIAEENAYRNNHGGGCDV